MQCARKLRASGTGHRAFLARVARLRAGILTEGEWIGRLVGGRFRVTRECSVGRHGMVYAAEQQMWPTVRKAAIKISFNSSKDPSASTLSS